MKTSPLLPVLVLLSLQQVHARRKPNLLLVLADDLGVNDVSWNNPGVTWSPTLDWLARSGTILDTAYTLPVCSPSRAALLTGVLPYKFGFQVSHREFEMSGEFLVANSNSSNSCRSSLSPSVTQ